MGRFFRYSRRFFYVIGGIVIVLIGVRLALPYLVKHYVNRKLQESKDYAGHVGDIDLSLWRGAYEIKNINIFKRSGKIHEPFFSAPYMDLSLQWGALFHHRIVAKIYMQQPHLNFVKGPTPEQTQAGENTSWNRMLEGLTPFKLNRLDIHDGQMHYLDDYSTPKVDIYFRELGASATNLSNARNQKLPLPAGIVANARTIGNGTMNFNLQFNPVAPRPEYQLQASLTNVNLPALNDFFRAYGKFDVAQGTFAMFTSVAATNQAYAGYVKVLFKNLDVFEWKKERQKNILQIFWEAILGAVTTVFRNQPHDQLAAKIPISGVYTNSQVDLISAIGSLMRNAFIRALLPKYDQKITTGQVASMVKQGQIPNANAQGNGVSPTNNFTAPPSETNKPATRLEMPPETTGPPGK
ncbi:MAG TPA: DUF748 domain-containing protein [Verrucomicrobiae bacterium]|nr:DUF748 domain-containing protein [Verrucomicrobiae bacterium]